MEIKLTRENKLVLLKACQTGIFNTDSIPELKKIAEMTQPARVLTQKEAKEFLQEIERNC